ncbi:HAD-superfamily hydrolase, subfamily IIB [Stanieria cyanosphaera PCC 7437]|uniref:HAD-superfamily hydrolase, subfamily IIB n=1 Tax=Stanieria cyanosphaera (strain ATCC 29371 / PCC 7437) TaxID=111780 RepID=K9XUR6_STAC7|nr:HAD family hydrolase [Stanieria cyanosphaera]AFZ36345.1 HAD-superfamily hydrolase, subfamily IIB [Stanieria cyanosphaera PCC 7437]
MNYSAIASDYDGTLATEGKVDLATLAAVNRWKESGRKFILVTGRRISSLQEIFEKIDICDYVVAENGAVLYHPQSQTSYLLCQPASTKLIERLQQKDLKNIAVGEAIVATWQPHEEIVRETIAELNLSLEIILNKRAIMILPTGINKASGLELALNKLNLTASEVIGVGDAENDLDLLKYSGLGVAVGNALTEVKHQADWVTKGERGLGIQELIQRQLK